MLAHLRIVRVTLVMIVGHLRAHLMVVVVGRDDACAASTGSLLPNNVDILPIKEVIHDLMAILIHSALPVVWAQHVDSRVCLVLLGALRYDNRAALSHGSSLHNRLHRGRTARTLSTPMLTLNAKARHRCPFLMIEVDLLLSLI